MVDPTSLYPQPPAPAQAQSPVAAIGQFAEVRNALFQGQLQQQHIKQAEMATQLQAAKNKALAKLNDPKYLNPQDSTLDANAWIADLAKDPQTALYVPEAIATRSQMNALTPTGRVDAKTGQPGYGATQSVAAAYNPTTGAPAAPEAAPQGTPQGDGAATPPHQTNSPTGVMAPPVGFSTALPQSRSNYDKVTADAAGAPTQNAAYNEVINLANQGTLSGVNLTKAYAAASRNDYLHIFSGATEETVKNQELAKWLSQGLLASGMPGSDARLQELQHGNLNPGQLTDTIKDLAPFFKAVSEGTIAKQKYYNKVTDNGTNLATEPHANERWNENYDPRWIEFADLPKKDQRAFLTKHPDMIERRQQYHNLQNMGVVQ